ncbi:MAG: hypothetical protein JW818_19605 [Pirellulales bacterium]|nr:hypothetical protein [Pirellulales bacterium]
MTIDPKTRQQLLELVYDLLAEDEAAELTARIEADPELAQAYAEAQRTARVLAEGAKVVTPPVPLKRPEAIMSKPTPASTSTSPSKKPKPVAAANGADRSRGRGLTWTVGTVAAVLLLISAGSYWWHHAQLSELASAQLRLVVAGPARYQAGMTNQYTIRTTGVTGDPMPSGVTLVLYAPDGKELLRQNDETDDQGQLTVTLPPNLNVRPGSRLNVVVAHDNKPEQIETKLAVDGLRLATQLGLDKPLYKPGETVFYRSLTLSRFGLDVKGEVLVQFKILDPSGAVVPGSELQGVTEHGVGNGLFTLPPGVPGGEYTLVAQSPAFPEEKRTFFVRSYRLPRLKKELEFQRESYAPGEKVVADFSAERAEKGPAAGAKLHITAMVDDKKVHEADVVAAADGTFQVDFTLPEKIEHGRGQLVVVADDGGTKETIAKTIPINLGTVLVEFFPEGGDLASGLENRVYFTVRDPLGDPAELKGFVTDAQGTPVALVETKHEGMGVFTFTPQAGQTYQLKIDTPKVDEQPRLPEVKADRHIVLSTGQGVFGPGAPLEFNVRASKADLPLVASAWCRGVPVGQQAFTTQVGANTVSVPLSDDASGVVRLTVYDYSASPPKPVAERLIYRRPVHQLDIQVAAGAKAYSPGEAVRVDLTAVDESGQRVPEAVLGVAVVDDALVNLADDDTPSMPTHFLLTTEVDKPEDLEDADFYLSDDPEAPQALDLLLGTQGWRRFVEKTIDELKKEKRDDKQIARLIALGGVASPPAVFDNLAKISRDYETSLAQYREGRTRALTTLTTVALFAGVGLVLFVAMLSLLGAGGGIRVWVPALGAAAACIVVGALLMNPDRLAKGPHGSVAFQSFNVEPTTTEIALGERLGQTASGVNPNYWWGFNNWHEGRDGDAFAVDFNNLALYGDFNENGNGIINENFFWAMPDASFKAGDINVYFNALPKDGLAADRRFLAYVPKLRDADRLAALGLEALQEAELPGRRHLRLGAIQVKQLMENPNWANGVPIAAYVYPTEEALERLHVTNGERYGINVKSRKELLDALKKCRFSVRQYAHKHVVRKKGTRSDFAESLYWNPLLVCDKQGKATVNFELCDSVTTFRVAAEGHGRGGRIGTGQGSVVSRIPFSLEPKLPLEVTAGDRIDLPLAVVNDTQKTLPVEIRYEGQDDDGQNLVKLTGAAQRKLSLEPGQRAREVFTLDVTGQKGDCRLTFRGKAGTLADAVERPLRIVPPGFPKDLSYSGRIDGEQEVVVDLPKTWVPGSLEVTLNAFPSTLADLQQGVEGMLREPNGCFEQASTSNYPNVLSLQYLEEHDVAAPTVTRHARDLLKKGYGKLTGYESKKHGYEWFGGDPGHEALTAYGLMEFRDMAKVYPVDELMLGRTAKWLLDRRDGKGGFKRNDKALDSFGRASEDITNAYITWALAESGEKDIDAEVNHAIALADKSDDPYLVALAASAALCADKKEDAGKLLKKLADWQADDGHLVGKDGSITRSGGLSLKVETTALAALGWLRAPKFTKQADKAIDWITKNRQGSGGFGSTQGTILALKALVEHAKANSKTASAGTLLVKRDDKTVAEFPFAAGRHETISVEGLEAELKPGDNRLTISLSGENRMPYALDVSFRTRKPNSDPACPVRLTTSLAEAKVASGQTVALSAKLENTTDKGQPMTVAILGLPAGLEAQPEQLEDLKKAGTIDYYETGRREVICYWRSLAPKRQVDLKLDLIAAVPGRYTGPASRAYLYYTAEQKQWTDPLEVEIK